MNEEAQKASPSPSVEVGRTIVEGNQEPIKAPLSTTETLAFGSRRPAMKRWVPRRWEHWYTECVIFGTTGLFSNVELGAKYNCTPTHIGLILNTPQAKEIRKALHARYTGQVAADIPATTEQLVNRALENVNRILSSDGMLESKPEFVGNLSMKVLMGAGKFNNPNEKRGINVHGNAIIFDSAAQDALKKADQVSKMAAEIHDTKKFDGPKLIKSGTDG